MKQLRRVIKPLASLKLMVVLLAASMFLVFAGTLAQTQDGVWTVVEQYFRSPIVRIELQMFVPHSFAKLPDSLSFLFPGGMTIGILLLVNLVSAHIVYFRYSFKRLGIIVMHFGIILLLIGEFVTGAAAREGNMSILEGSYSNFIEDTRSPELAFIRPSKVDADLDDVVVVPHHMLKSRRSGTQISDEAIPCDIRIDEWMPNSQLAFPADLHEDTRAMLLGRANAGLGLQGAAVSMPTVTGVDSQSMDAPSTYITFYKKGSNFTEALGSYMLSVYLLPESTQTLTVDSVDYNISLRFKRVYKPYELHLIDFKHDLFVGTKTARNFSSELRLVDRARNVDRQTVISMNHPLRYQGETFYQSSYKPDNTGTVLQVVNNPGWLIPYISCILVTLGMLWHFCLRLGTFVRRQSR